MHFWVCFWIFEFLPRPCRGMENILRFPESRGFRQMLHPPLFTGFFERRKNPAAYKAKLTFGTQIGQLSATMAPFFLRVEQKPPSENQCFWPFWPRSSQVGATNVGCIMYFRYRVFGKIWAHRYLQGVLNVAKTLQNTGRNPAFRPQNGHCSAKMAKNQRFLRVEDTLKNPGFFGHFGQHMAKSGPQILHLPLFTGFSQNFASTTIYRVFERHKNPVKYKAKPTFRAPNRPAFSQNGPNPGFFEGRKKPTLKNHGCLTILARKWPILGPKSRFYPIFYKVFCKFWTHRYLQGFCTSQKPCKYWVTPTFCAPNWPFFGQNVGQQWQIWGPKSRFYPVFTGFLANFESTAIYGVFWTSQKPCNIQGKTHFLGSKSASFRPTWPKPRVFWGSKKPPSKEHGCLAFLANAWPV